MQTVLNNLFNDASRATGIWLALLVLAGLAIAGLTVRADRGRREGNPPGDRLGSRAGDDTVAISAADRTGAVLTHQARELRRYAEEVRVAADRAATMAGRRRAQWLAAQDEAAAAWTAYDAADTAVRRSAAADVLPLPRTTRTPAEYADRERYLHRAAMTACSRNELSVLELSDALAHRNGWDPRRHPIEQEAVLRRAVRDGLRAEHRAAAEREQAAWGQAEAAATAAASLREEAVAAAGRARWVQRWSQPLAVPEKPGAVLLRRLQSAELWRTVRRA